MVPYCKWIYHFLFIFLGAPCLWYPLQASAQSNSAAEEHAQRGADLVSEGNWEEAIKELNTAVRLDPNSASTHTNLGMAYYFKGNIGAAVSEFQAALVAAPERVDAAHGLGLALYEKGDLDGAVAAFRTSSRQNATANYNLGNALEQKGDRAGALEAYKHYLAAAPQAPEATALDDAVKKGVTPTPAAGTAKEHFQRGQALLDKKEAKEAVVEFLAALRLKPSSVEACNGLGSAFRAEGDLEQAIAGYQMALHLDPKFAVAYRNLGQAFEEKGDSTQAAQFYDRYLMVAPGVVDAPQVRDKVAQLRAARR